MRKKTDDELKVKRKFDIKRLLYVAGGISAVILGIYIAGLFSHQRDNTFLAFGTIALWAGAIYLVYRGLKKREVEAVIVGTEKPQSGTVNSLSIYARKDKATGKVYAEKVVFENVYKPTGQPWQCLNDSKWYYVNIFDIESNCLKPFALPDGQYFDPREFANVIKVPAHRKLFERQASMLQKIAPWVMVVAFFIALFGLIATTPGG